MTFFSTRWLEEEFENSTMDTYTLSGIVDVFVLGNFYFPKNQIFKMIQTTKQDMILLIDIFL